MTGTLIPMESIIMGQFFNIFISYNTASQLPISFNVGGNITCTTNTAQKLLNSLANISDQIFCDATREGNVINSASNFVCDPDQTLTEQATSACVTSHCVSPWGTQYLGKISINVAFFEHAMKTYRHQKGPKRKLRQSI